MTSTFALFGLTVYPYGLIAGGAAILYLLFCGVARYRSRLPVGTARVYGALAFPVGLLLSRVVFCLFSLDSFRDGDGLLHVEWMLRFFDGGYSLIGLMAGLMLAALIASRIQKERFGFVADMAVVPMGLLILALRLAEGFVKTAEGEPLIGFGKYLEESALTKGVPFLFLSEQLGGGEQYMLAVYRLEAAVGLLLLLVTLVVRFAPRKRSLRAGDMALLFFSLFGASQVFLEYLRNDGHMWLNFAVRGSQILSALMPLLATILLGARLRRILGKRLAPALCTAASILTLLVVALMEFAIDGRISLGNLDPTVYYVVMALSCVLMALIPACLLRALTHKAYRQDVFGVKLGASH